MRPAAQSLIGLIIGCGLAAGFLSLAGPWIFSGRIVLQNVQMPAMAAARALAPVVAAGSLRILPQMPAVSTPTRTPVTTSAPMLPAVNMLPNVIYPGRRARAEPRDPNVVPVTMPNVIGPAPRRDAVVAATGFFIARDGSLLTASHVVRDCEHVRIVSARVRMTNAEILAQDGSVDVALLRARVQPPAILALASERPESTKLFVLGYPATANLRIPDETWATLENASLPPGLGKAPDTRQTVWLHSFVVTHGYSGGPMYDPRIGAVAGLVKAGIEPKYVTQSRTGFPDAGLSFGPGAAQLAAFVHRAAPELDLEAESTAGGEALDNARRATVHVLCWR